MPEEFRNLLSNIERTKKQGFSEMTLALIDMDQPSREEFTRQLNERVDSVRRGESARDITYIFQELSRGISVMIVRQITNNRMTQAREYCFKKAVELKIKYWYCILIEPQITSIKVDFFIIP